ncbi:MAG: hypothetical protein KGL39_47730 [Patescibacteria group bacterium]|nr:hypothetical protein [Patescibacteria group bacterium]
MSLQKLPPAWHTQVADELNKDFAETNAIVLNARKRAAYLGLKFIWVKENGKADGSIPHGQFDGWLEKFCPQIPRSTIGDYITEGRSLCERMGIQISEIRKFETPPHKLLECPDAAKNDKERKAQQLLLDLVEAKGKFRPVTEYKQVDEHGNTRRGAPKGSAGCTKKMRLDARFASDQEMLVELKLWMEQTALRLMEDCGVKKAGRVDEVPGGAAALKQFTEAVAYAHSFLQDLKRGRNS